VSFDHLLESPPGSVTQPEKERLLLDGLNELTAFHRENSPEYRRITDAMWDHHAPAQSLSEIPYVPVGLFKEIDLRSVPADQVKLTLTSSGTTGARVSRIAVDAETSSRQQRALQATMAQAFGPKRLPMLLIDTADVFKRPDMMSARGAGVLGMMRFGRNHAFALRPDLSVDEEAVAAFLDRFGDAPFAVFGFTFMVWQFLYQPLRASGRDLSNGILVHSGGWKKLIEQAVGNEAFRQALGDAFRLRHIFNFYGMVEQLGSVFLEGPDNLLYPPNFTDVIIRDPRTWEPAPLGQAGVIQLLSLIPRSYPGHSLLTEDMGVVERIDSGPDGGFGKGLRIIGRVSKAELRGCSDVFAQSAGASRP
jgi:phenylacetate-coenzyme A ligase PaaK-like adenylate-forming protein